MGVLGVMLGTKHWGGPPNLNKPYQLPHRGVKLFLVPQD